MEAVGPSSENVSAEATEDHGSQGIHTGRVIFLLNNLPFDPEDDFPGTLPNLPYRIDNLAATYISPLDQILSSRLNAAGLVRAIYVNFGPRGFYELNPNSRPVTQPSAFEAMLRHLFNAGTISNPSINQVLWQKVTDFSSIVSNLPANIRKIGCVHGAGYQGSANLRDYITDAPDEQSYFCVVGQIANQDMEAYIDDLVKVSGYPLSAETCLSRICIALERKWKIH